MKILFTGEAGQLAVHISQVMRSVSGIEIVNAQEGVFPYPTAVSGHHPWPELDVRNDEIGYSIGVHKPDVVIHSAAVVNTDKCASNPKNSIDVNLLGTYNVLKACEYHGVKLVYFSTTATYDPAKIMPRPFTETSPQRPPTLYGITKYAGEMLVTGQKKVPWLVIRPCFVYGDPPLDHSSQLCRIAVHQVLVNLHYAENNPLTVTLNPKSLKDYMRVEDFARAVTSLFTLPAIPWGNAFNISGESPRKMGTYFKELQDALDMGKLDMVWDADADYMGDHRVDSTLLRATTGWKPEIDWRDGVRKTADAAIRYVTKDISSGKVPLLYK